MKQNKGLFLATTLALLLMGASVNPARVMADSYSTEDNRKTYWQENQSSGAAHFKRRHRKTSGDAGEQAY